MVIILSTIEEDLLVIKNKKTNLYKVQKGIAQKENKMGT